MRLAVDFGEEHRPRLPDFWLFFLGVLVMLAIIVSIARAEPIYLTASWYSVESLKRDGQWKITKGVCSDGSTFKDSNLTAASRDFNLGDFVYIVNLQTGKKIVVKITDRINKRFKGKRIDLSRSAMEALGGKQALIQGLLPVRVERIANGR